MWKWDGPKSVCVYEDLYLCMVICSHLQINVLQSPEESELIVWKGFICERVRLIQGRSTCPDITTTSRLEKGEIKHSIHRGIYCIGVINAAER